VIYLIHILLLTLAIEVALAFAGTTSLAPIPAAFVVAAPAAGIAHAVHLVVERPLNRWLKPKRNRGKAELAIAPVAA
jgi:peptidoglycan/LPS O-acetylase OafA/YrhL